MPTNNRCTVTSCDDYAVCKGMCRKHYRAKRLYGDPEATKRPESPDHCCVDACEAPHFAKGRCHHHYMIEYRARKRRFKAENRELFYAEAAE
ncbi:hypothetical protein [Thalassospira xiamenensis]|uniref:hypothetical protein n=1 Tax=Thalassospira xiamenensis TaxID=220697 RepID=UPI003AA9C7BC